MINHPWVEFEGTLFTLRFPAEPELELIESFGAACHGYYSTNERPFAWVVDGSKITMQGVRQRKALSEVLERDYHHLKQSCLGMGIVVPNAMVRGAAQAVLWLAPPAYDYRFFKDETSARTWAANLLAEKV